MFRLDPVIFHVKLKIWIKPHPKTLNEKPNSGVAFKWIRYSHSLNMFFHTLILHTTYSSFTYSIYTFWPTIHSSTNIHRMYSQNCTPLHSKYILQHFRYPPLYLKFTLFTSILNLLSLYIIQFLLLLWTGAVLLGGQGGHLPAQFFRDQRQRMNQNCKICATCMYLL